MSATPTPKSGMIAENPAPSDAFADRIYWSDILRARADAVAGEPDRFRRQLLYCWATAAMCRHLVVVLDWRGHR